MRITNLHNHRKGRANSKYTFGVLITLALVVSLIIFTPVGTGITNIFRPLFSVGSKAYSFVDVLPEWLKSRPGLISRIEQLEQEIEQLKLKESDYAALLYENNKLKTELNINIEENFERAFVVARSPQIPFDTVLVDKGENSGVAVGNLVLASEKSLIGVIKEVYPQHSIVALYSFVDMKSTMIVGRTKNFIEIKGGGSGNIYSETPLEFDIKPGDSVLSQGPKNYTAAIIGSVEENKSLGIKKLLMSLPVNVGRVDIVYILKHGNEYLVE